MTDLESMLIGEARESIETNLWQAEDYEAQGASGLARECVEAAYSEFLLFDDQFRALDGDDIEQRVEAARKRWALEARK